MKKHILFSIVLVISLFFMTATAMALNGDGSEETPFEITSQEELRLLDDFPDCHFKLMNDIELDGTWVPLCKDINDGFTGTLDGQGYAVSNLKIVNYYTVGTGFISVNNGMISNLNIKTSDDGITISVPSSSSSSSKKTISFGVLVGENNGSISDCTAIGTISLSIGSYTTVYLGGIAGKVGSNGYINNCNFKGELKVSLSYSGCSSVYPYVGGIAGYSKGKINNCYCIGSFSNFYSGVDYSNGITSGGTITNCYSVVTGIKNGISSSGTKTSCFYDKTVSGLTDTNGEGKTTLAMKMKKTFADAGWDFENIWAIDSEYNDGYPYLQFEREQAEVFDYTVKSIVIKGGISETVLEAIPETDSFYAEIALRKNTERSDKDCIMIIGYDEEGFMVDYTYAKLICGKDQSLTIGSKLSNINGQIKTIKAFVWDGVTEAKPLSNVLEY